VEARGRVLLAFDPEPERRGWGQFGGGAQGSETLAETASRELHEETNCAVSLPAETLARLRPSRAGSFYSYAARIPYVPVEEIARDRPGCRDVERSRWVWVRYADLVAALRVEGGSGETSTLEGEPDRVHLWPGALASLRQALADGVLPQRDPCSAGASRPE
jgi:8-oxo-dGTP pyrophosphatase MutT (NUDIX family)